ncbi:DUF551 domain-containing protein [Pseudorhodoferax sp. Leaf265]|uniref:DUF551 domain-containing protein n=1 Tax=Pseudorhodoferax sp. Leaf265 TaxID=1736315 RepID=UPI0006F86CF0|nr:DUF551 domain-containing protein [Pseudorhodoferax sp. Leaf265]KQP02486.1 hypothetical protein ASF45_20750 [Pseudorhodoferax sp. Leaf265]
MRQDTFRVREVVRYEVRHDMSDSRFAGSDSIGLFRSLKAANNVAALLASDKTNATLIQLTEAKPTWLSIEDVQPGRNVEVLCLCRRNDGSAAFEVASITAGGWTSSSSDGYVRHTITHWMPVPPEPGNAD